MLILKNFTQKEPLFLNKYLNYYRFTQKNNEKEYYFPFGLAF